MSALACFTFDNLGEAAEVGAGTLVGPRPPGTDPSIAVGLPRLLDLLERRGVRASFFVEGWNGEHHPESIAAIVGRGHEVGMHGFVHEAWSALPAEEERALATRATEAIERAAGVRPRGFRAPGGVRSESTAAILASLGYEYDASLGDGTSPGRLSNGLVQVPFVWPGVDGFHYLREQPAAPESVRDAWLRALARAIERDGLFLLICHAFITGIDERRCAALDAVVAAAIADPRVEVVSAADVAARVP